MTVRRFRKTYLRLLTLPGYSQLLMNNRCSSPSCSFEPVPPRSCFPAQVARWCPPSAIHPPLFAVRFVSAPSTPPQLGTTAAFIQTTNSPSVAFHCSFFIWAAQWDLVILLRWLTIYHKRKDSHFLNFRHFSQYRHICSMCVLMIFVKGQIWCWRWGSLVAPAALSVVLTPGPTGCLRVIPSESVEEMPSHRHAWQTVAPHLEVLNYVMWNPYLIPVSWLRNLSCCNKLFQLSLWQHVSKSVASAAIPPPSLTNWLCDLGQVT